jgi:SOS-response transcriptional repressor LexA
MKEEEYKELPLPNRKIYDLILNSSGGVQRSFAESIGVSAQVIGRLFKKDDRNGKYPSISPSIKEGIKNKYGFSDVWFVTESNEVNSVEVPVSEKGEIYNENARGAKFFKSGENLYMETTLVPYDSYGRYANEANILEPEREEWEKVIFEVPNVVHGNYLAFEVKGDSMDNGSRNSFEEGDIVLVRELERDLWRERLRFNDYPYWVVVFDSSVLIKEMINQDINKGDITFHSINPSPEYSDFTLNIDNIRKLFYVIKKRPKDVVF